MNKSDVKKRVAEIAAVTSDFEAAHGREDDLYRDVLRAIAEGAPDAAKLAAEALKTQELDFDRYTA